MKREEIQDIRRLAATQLSVVLDRLCDEIERLNKCPMCIGDELEIEPDKDCMCGGSRLMKEYIRGLNGCIDYWREKAK